MRFLFKTGKQRQFLKNAINYSNLTRKEFAVSKINVPYSTFRDWLYENNTLPEDIFYKIILDNPQLKYYSKYIEQKKEDSWGQIKGGKETYKVLIEKYGIVELERRRKKGNLISSKNKLTNAEFSCDIYNPEFLEFLGILFGDGWLSNLHYKNKEINLIGISGHMVKDKEFLNYVQKKIFHLFNRRATIKVKEKENAMDLVFSHKQLLNFLNKKLYFSIGKNRNLKIIDELLSWKYSKHIIRGVFDTDGSIYFDKFNPGLYPVLEICMRQPYLISQIGNILKEQGFNLRIKDKERIILKGKHQVYKWYNEIMPNNSRHLEKFKRLDLSA